MEKKDVFSDYLAKLDQDKKDTLSVLRNIINENLPIGFKEVPSYGAIGYVVPHEIYPAGYHCSPELPLPFINLAAQKNFVALYHMGLYADKELLAWFTTEYPKHSKFKLDMGKSCIRFKTIDRVPELLIAALCKKMTPSEWISIYDRLIKRNEK